jgi:alpha-L-rhamnosidase
VFDSGRHSDISSLCYELPITLEPCTRYHWRVTVWTNTSKLLESDWAFFETGKLTAPWTAAWVRVALPSAHDHPYLRREFSLPGPATWARAYVCGLGLYELFVNGRKVGAEHLMPGYHTYNYFVQYQTYDVTAHLRPGANCVGAMLGPGWYMGYFATRINQYGKTMQLICEVQVRCGDAEVVIGTDGGWLGRAGPIKWSGIYEGESYDWRREVAGWAEPGCDPAGWVSVEVTGRTIADLVERVNPPLTVHERLKPARVIRNKAGEVILDFGQEITGWVELRVRAAAKVKLEHVELVVGNRFCTDTLRGAPAKVQFIAAGATVWRPHFTYFGFRYVRVSGLAKVNPDDFTACAIYSDIDRVGWIEASDPRLNRIFENTLWSQKDNFLDIPTDCP